MYCETAQVWYKSRRPAISRKSNVVSQYTDYVHIWLTRVPKRSARGYLLQVAREGHGQLAVLRISQRGSNDSSSPRGLVTSNCSCQFNVGGFQFETTTNSPLVTRNTTPFREENPPSRPQTGSQNRPAVRRLTVSQTRLALVGKERRAAEQGPGGGEGRAGLIGQQVFVLDAPRQYDERRHTSWKGQQPSSLSFPLLVSRISWPISSRLETEKKGCLSLFLSHQLTPSREEQN